LTVQQNCFSDLYPAKILDLPAKPFSPCVLCARFVQKKNITRFPRKSLIKLTQWYHRRYETLKIPYRELKGPAACHKRGVALITRPRDGTSSFSSAGGTTAL